MDVMRFLLISVILLLCLAAPSLAEGVFGMNKVQYRNYDWRLVQTSHFDLYYYEGGDSLVAFAAREVETLYEEAASFMKHRLSQRIPIIVHNTHAQFQQTNVIRYPIPEAVGGFTEVFKNRIVLPFDGDYASFQHVIQHEMIHAMMFDLVSQGRKGYSTAAKLGTTPLWASEGLAELGSLGWEISSEPYLLDAVSSGYINNPVMGLWGFMAYKGGQNFLYFVESNWGRGTVAKMFHSISEGLSFEFAFLRATRVSLEEAGEIWLRETRRIYWPELGRRQYAKTIARAMTDHRKDQSYYNVQPTLSPDGKRIAFFSDRGDREAVFLLDVETERVTRTAIEGGHVAAHESFHAFQSALAWAWDSRHLVLVSKQGGRDVVHVVDANRSKVVSELVLGDLEAISSPSLSPQGDFLVVSGQRLGVMDLYRVDLPVAVGQKGFPERLTLEPKALTKGYWTEENPRISPSGNWVAFQSDRDRNAQDTAIQSKTDVYVLNLKDLSVRQVSRSRWSSASPVWGEDDSTLVYVSNRSGVPNAYMQETFGDSLWPLTNLIAGVSSPSLSADASAMAFALFENGGWDIFLMKDPWSKKRSEPLPVSRFIEVAEDSTGTQALFEPIIFENLKSWRDSASMDSLEQKIQDHIPNASPGVENSPGVAPPDESGDFFLDPPSEKTRKAQDTSASTSFQKDSLNQDSAKVDSLSKDSVKAVRHSWMSGIDTTKIFLPGGSAPAFNADGSLKSVPYTPQWSLDQAVAVAGFSSNSGVGGQGALTFSDLMGDREFNLWFFGGGRLDNLNIFMQYGYMPKRLDMAGSVFHHFREGSEKMTYTRFLELHDSISTDPVATDSLIGLVPYGDRSFGASLDLSYPLSVYARVDFSSALTWRTRKWFEQNETESSSLLGSSLKEDTLARSLYANTLEMMLSWSFDNAEWGVTGPVLGERLWVGGRLVPPEILQDENAYWRLDMDFRKYFRAFKRYTLALRMAGGMSEAISGYANPHRYLLGGDDWTINWHFNESQWKGTQNDVFFSTWETPLRGFRYHDFTGTRMALFNAEFRFPFIEQLSLGWPIPLTITQVTGVVFTDFGGTWENRNVLENRGLGFGWGWRLNLGIFVLRYTKGWAVDEASTINRSEYTYWSLGAEF